MIRDIKEFSRMFRIRIPYHREFDYYIRVLSKSPEYAGILALVDEFQALEEEAKKQDVSVGSYKMESVKTVKEFLAGTEAFTRMSESDLSGTTSKIDRLNEHDTRFLVSFDLVKANYATLFAFDEKDQIPEDWTDLLGELNLHPILGRSKSFRQLVFGGLEPKKQQALQASIIEGVLERLDAEGIEQDDILKIAHDEVVIAGTKLKGRTRKIASILLEMADEAEDPEAFPEIPEIFRGKLKFKVRVSKLRSLEDGIFVRETYDPSLQDLMHKSLVGVPGNRFFIEFKKNITGESLDDRDLLFINEHRLAKWVMDKEGNHIAF